MPANAEQLDRLQAEIPQLWRGRGTTTQPTLPTGHHWLDSVLPGGGWPVGALTEILHNGPGLGELSLLLPALCQCSQAGRRIALIAPPLLPNGPLLAERGVDLQQLLLIRCNTPAERRWAAAQCLRSGLFGCLLLWPGPCADHELRRLQLAAEQSQAVSVLYRDGDSRHAASPAQLRLLLQAQPGGQRQLWLLKARGLSCSAKAPRRLDWAQDEPGRQHDALAGLAVSTAGA